MRNTTMKTHDYTDCHWGHNINIMKILDEGQGFEAVGWGPLVGGRIEQGDALILKAKGGRTARYKVSTIDYYQDPDDMWKATLEFYPRRYKTLEDGSQVLIEED